MMNFSAKATYTMGWNDFKKVMYMWLCMFISCTRLLLRNRHTGNIIELITTAPSTDSEHSKHTFCFPNPGLATRDNERYGTYGLDTRETWNLWTGHELFYSTSQNTLWDFIVTSQKTQTLQTLSLVSRMYIMARKNHFFMWTGHHRGTNMDLTS